MWSFGREDRLYLENTFVPDRINIAIVLLNQNRKILQNKYKYNREQTFFLYKTCLPDQNCPLSIVHCQLNQSWLIGRSHTWVRPYG